MKITILTNFQTSRAGYALYNVVIAQADALAQFGNEVTIVTNESYTQTEKLPKGFKAKPISVLPPLPEPKLDYTTKKDLSAPLHTTFVKELSSQLLELVKDQNAVFTHDWVFTGWNMPYALALQAIAEKTRDVRFLHWIHSITGKNRDWWELRRYGKNHRLVYPNRTSAIRVAAAYQTDIKNILYIPHIVDLRHLFEFDQETLDLLESFPEIMESRIVQIYPFSAERAQAKGVRELILLFSKIKDRGWSVCLVLACAHADTPEGTKQLAHLERIAKRNGLKLNEDLVVLSDRSEGVPRSTLLQLAMMSNVFIYPSQQETFGLVLPEISLASGAMPVINKSLGEMVETSAHNGLLADFGSYNVEWTPTSETVWLDHLAGQIVSQVMNEEGVRSRTWFRTRYNRDAVYHRYYVPILEGSGLW